jgi:hypothetical protein
VQVPAKPMRRQKTAQVEKLSHAARTRVSASHTRFAYHRRASMSGGAPRLTARRQVVRPLTSSPRLASANIVNTATHMYESVVAPKAALAQQVPQHIQGTTAVAETKPVVVQQRPSPITVQSPVAAPAAVARFSQPTSPAPTGAGPISQGGGSADNGIGAGSTASGGNGGRGTGYGTRNGAGPGIGSGGPFGIGGDDGGDNGGPKHVVYVLDVSPSMTSRIDRARSELASALETLKPTDMFDVEVFGGTTRICEDSLVAATHYKKAEAEEFLNTAPLVPGTDLDLAMETAFSVSGVNIVVVITDGVPTEGETNFKKLAKLIAKRNINHARIYTIGLVGRNPNDGTDDSFQAANLLQTISSESGGSSKLATVGVIDPD